MTEFKATGNPLATNLRVQCEGGIHSRVIVFVHGLSMNDRKRKRHGHDHGEALTRDLNASALYVT